MEKRPRGSPRRRITMLFVEYLNIATTFPKNVYANALHPSYPYRPGWRGGRRDIGAPRCTGALKPPDFPFDLDDFPPPD